MRKARRTRLNKKDCDKTKTSKTERKSTGQNEGEQDITRKTETKQEYWGIAKKNETQESTKIKTIKGETQRERTAHTHTRPRKGQKEKDQAKMISN